MKTVCVLHHVSALGGGTKSFIDVLNMLKTKYNVIACVPKGSRDIIEILITCGIEYRELENPIPVLSYYSGGPLILSRTFISPLLRLINEKKLVNEILNINPDAIIFNSIVSTLIARNIPDKIIKIAFVRETFKNGFGTKIFKNILEKHFKGVCFIADHERKYIQLKKPVTEIIPDCLSPNEIFVTSTKESRKKLSIPNDKFVILYLGGSSYIKGADVILKAMSKLSDEYLLIFAGYFDERDLSIKNLAKHFYSLKYLLHHIKLRKAYMRVKAKNVVRNVGFCSDISGYMNACDVVVFPSNKAHQPRPAIEAGEYKKPVIISNFSATEEYFIDGYNALTFDPHSHKDLAKKILDFRNNPKKKFEYGLNNNEMTRRKHSYYETEKKLKSFIDRCFE